MRFNGLLVKAGMLLAVFLFGFAVLAHEGEEVTRLAKPQSTETPGKIEVIEFFWYGCPHCNELEPLLDAWEKRQAKDVAVRREHVVWQGRRETEIHARLYLTLQAMNLVEKHHRAVFDAIHKDKLPLRDEAQIFGWAAKRGIDRAQFEATYKSFGIQTQANRARDRTFSFEADGVPGFVVNGKTKATLGAAHSAEKLFATLDKLIAEERLLAKKK